MEELWKPQYILSDFSKIDHRLEMPHLTRNQMFSHLNFTFAESLNV